MPKQVFKQDCQNVRVAKSGVLGDKAALIRFSLSFDIVVLNT